MRYDEKNGVIVISTREFVSTARRGISTFGTCDEDEPIFRKASKRLLDRVLGEREEKKLGLKFTAADFTLSLDAKVEKADGNAIWIIYEVDCNPERPKREYVAEARGEGYVSALAYAKESALTEVKINFIYTNSETEKYSEACEFVKTGKLESFFNKCAVSVGIYAKPEIDRVTKRLPTMKALRFPYEMIRDGQEEFIQKAYKNIARGTTLFATAPTGTGKTVSVLYPALRAMGDGKRDKTFYLTPKDTTAEAAVDCLKLFAKSGADIRAIKITAKDKCCKNGRLCRENRDLCENSKSKKLPDALLALYNEKMTVVTGEAIDSIAKSFKVCPYELSLTYAELCDVVICDVNYLFDPDVYIRRFFEMGGNYTFLIDEAHNLPDRARELYSAEISEEELLPLELDALLGEHSKLKKVARVARDEFVGVLLPLLKEELRVNEDGEKYAAVHAKEIPIPLYDIFDLLLDSSEEEIFTNRAARDEEADRRAFALRDYYYKIKKFRSVMQCFDSSYEMFAFYSDGKIKTKLFCIDTGKEISKRLEKGRAAVFFSATLTPLYYYKSILGGDSAAETLALDSPFVSKQLSVSIMDAVSTRYSERADTLSAVCRVIAATVSAKRGNYMIFAPSFVYAEALSKVFSAKYPKIRTLLQRKNMTAAEKRDFLTEFSKDDKSYLVAFCVMGGIYSEGIDLAGDSLIGAVIVGIGMPGLSYEREAIAAYYDEKYEEGKQFAYIYPGMNRVLQAAGRVIRREDDRGVIVLVDDRFDDPIYKKIIPTLWRGMEFIKDPKELRARLDEFWSEA